MSGRQRQRIQLHSFQRHSFQRHNFQRHSIQRRSSSNDDTRMPAHSKRLETCCSRLCSNTRNCLGRQSVGCECLKIMLCAHSCRSARRPQPRTSDLLCSAFIK
jgi:hypothetical protein